MKKLAVIALLLLVPSLALAQDQRAQTPAPQSALLPDVFHRVAHTCQTFAQGCGPDNIVFGSFLAYIEVFIPFTANCTRHYINGDIEGALVGYQTFTGVLPGGTTHTLSTGFTLPAGLYKFISIVVCDNGKTAVSDWFRFRVI